MTDETPPPRHRRLSLPAWLWRLLLVSWHVPTTHEAPEPLTLTGLLRRHLAHQGRRHRRKETR
jgi:hypothetical protein